jgi:HSP20 family molecular chaperone IbpA
MLAAPLRGLEVEDISFTIDGDKVVIKGDERGASQHRHDVVVEEWRIGPYYREVSLPQTVDGTLTNATYGNGVLLLSTPKAQMEGAATPVNLQLRPISSTLGEWVGHAASDIHPADEPARQRD